ncbi:MAG: DNA-binding response regulator [Chloroflexi bacterium]|nr:MAG: DNA-binding response regulator [Chloroflexota bacterium]
MTPATSGTIEATRRAGTTPTRRTRSNVAPKPSEVPVPVLRVAVAAAYPAIRAGLIALLRDAGHEVVERVPEHDGSDLDGLEDRVDVLVLDAGAEFEVDREVATVVLAEPGTALVIPEDAPGALLRRDASATELDLAVRGVAAGLRVIDPAFATHEPPSGEAPTGAPLTPREIEVLQLLASGMTNRGAALALGISEHTVKFHVGSVLAKLGTRSRTEAVSVAARLGLLPL